MFRKFYPTVYLRSAYDVDFDALYQKGYRGLLTDIDNTLVPHGAPSDRRSEALFQKLHETGWKTCLISNNDEARVAPFAKNTGCQYICKAGKPGTSGYLKGMELMGTTTENTLFMGDQMFTDIFGANNTGMKSILVKPVQKDTLPHIILKRIGEAIIKPFYTAYAARHPSEL